MKKLLSISMGALLTIFAAACSNDDEIVPAEQSESESAYLSVRISGTGAAGTRATSDSDLEYGTSDEQDVKTATFYFYNTDGHLVAASEVNQLSNVATGPNTGSVNVEYMGEAVVKVSVSEASIATITNLVTVINAPATFVAKSTLDELEEEITDGYLNTGNDGFVMSTSTYKRTDAKIKSFVTVIENPTKSFKTSRADAESAGNADVVDVYVERLAVKVRVSVDIPATVDGVARKVEVGGKTIYKLGSDFTLVEADSTSESGYSVKYNQSFYARLRGWDLNGTTKKSNMMKRISTSWDETSPFADWNDANRFRSYWGMSYNYAGSAFAYPDRYKDDNYKTIYTPGENYTSDATDSCLDYISATQIANSFGLDNPDYCNENTNSYGVLQPLEATSVATNVLVRATLVDETNHHLSLLKRAGGMYFTYDGFIAYALDSWKKSNDEVTKFRIDGNEITAANLGIAVDNYLNGRACIKVKKNQGTITKLNDKGEAEESSDKDLNAALYNFTKTNYAVQYKNGDMYYSVPIRHLNENKEAEGYYGVVRNHIYDLTISDITAPGHGINVPGTPQPDPEDKDETIDTPDPDAPDDGDTPDPEDPNDPDPDGYDPNDPDTPDTGEPIIPNDEENEYYLKAKVNILSWRVVTHSVTLGK